MTKKIVEVQEVQVQEVQVVETVQKPRVGERCKQLILEGILDNKAILEQIKKEYPEGKTSMACIAWYKSDLKKKKVDPDQGYKDWLKKNENDLRSQYEASLVTE